MHWFVSGAMEAKMERQPSRNKENFQDSAAGASAPSPTLKTLTSLNKEVRPFS